MVTQSADLASPADTHLDKPLVPARNNTRA